MKELIKDIDINDYDYDLPDDRIAQYPVRQRDRSRLLFHDGKSISSDIFRNLADYIPGNSLLVFNNTKVIRARLLFRKASGAIVEIFCLEPLAPSDYEQSFRSKEPVEWKCIVGNLRKWKSGILKLPFLIDGNRSGLQAIRICQEGEAWRIRFSWDNSEKCFSEVIEAAGHIPLPPYINRNDEKADSGRYQTVYSSIKGSVAAPTAGLHFTGGLMKKLSAKGISRADITLHVGAGTFQPVRTSRISEHKMHTEHFHVTHETLHKLINFSGKIIAVGTTSVRTLESLYWIGTNILNGVSDDLNNLTVNQWEPYKQNSEVPLKDSLTALSDLMAAKGTGVINASTKIIIIPGYSFRAVDGMITNFHQPRSTLLLLVSAWTGEKWREIYMYALKNEFRFLSYGDSSLLLR